MAFRLMVKKMGILSRPLSIKMIKIKHLMIAIARLHNLYIDKRLQENKNHNNNWDSNQHGSSAVFTPTNVTFNAHKQNKQCYKKMQLILNGKKWMMPLRIGGQGTVIKWLRILSICNSLSRGQQQSCTHHSQEKVSSS